MSGSRKILPSQLDRASQAIQNSASSARQASPCQVRRSIQVLAPGSDNWTKARRAQVRSVARQGTARPRRGGETRGRASGRAHAHPDRGRPPAAITLALVVLSAGIRAMTSRSRPRHRERWPHSPSRMTSVPGLKALPTAPWAMGSLDVEGIASPGPRTRMRKARCKGCGQALEGPSAFSMTADPPNRTSQASRTGPEGVGVPATLVHTHGSPASSQSAHPSWTPRQAPGTAPGRMPIRDRREPARRSRGGPAPLSHRRAAFTSRVHARRERGVDVPIAPGRAGCASRRNPLSCGHGRAGSCACADGVLHRSDLRVVEGL